jgi:hypothetical protein
MCEVPLIHAALLVAYNIFWVIIGRSGKDLEGRNLSLYFDIHITNVYEYAANRWQAVFW